MTLSSLVSMLFGQNTSKTAVEPASIDYPIPTKLFKIEKETDGLGKVSYNLYTSDVDIYNRCTPLGCSQRSGPKDWYFVYLDYSLEELRKEAQRMYNRHYTYNLRRNVTKEVVEYIS